MSDDKPDIPEAMLAKWQRVVDLAADLVEVPASLVMRTQPPDHSVLVSSRSAGNPYSPGQSFELNERLYCYAVLRDARALVVRDAHADPDWDDNQDLAHGMSFYVGYPLAWPDGALFGTICVLDRQDNEKARRCRELLEAFRGVVETDLALLVEMDRRARAEAALTDTLETLEARVAERTRALTVANDGLRQEIASRQRAEQALLRREHELEEANTALRVLLSNMEESRHAFEEQILRQIKGLVLPHLARLRQAVGENEPARSYLGLAETNLEQITSSFADRLVTAFEGLTPMEAEIAQMVMNGQTTKDIARALSRETSTIEFHRNNIRRKLGIGSRRTNLRRYLLSLH
ncbi:GAF domain-containing protein [Kaustia mangrovi]|uniref:GAF domain-containing protein n=1 Tax=Kaustia mangrovi TaxID=2593653 RepID=A0A7S8C491_9HYPH|nr:LuxR C-terminal-related transcriptional regulator [Kaustia mangrovi]QPC43082.1 GAF domain-containing protein [Kaustia mangrovi]